MNIIIYLIRHGKTKGNLERRYVGGRTDEDLCMEGIDLLKILKDEYTFLNDIDAIYSGPMKRVLSTAKLFYDNKEINVIDNLTEMNFGDFENKNHNELDGNPAYQAFIDSNGTIDFPGGEKRNDFINRSMEAFYKVLTAMIEGQQNKSVVFCHGGNIMAILSRLFNEDMFGFQSDNGHGYKLELEIEDGKIIDSKSYSRI